MKPVLRFAVIAAILVVAAVPRGWAWPVPSGGAKGRSASVRSADAGPCAVVVVKLHRRRMQVLDLATQGAAPVVLPPAGPRASVVPADIRPSSLALPPPEHPPA